MDNLLIGGIVLSVVISLAVYYFLNKKLKDELYNMKKEIENNKNIKKISDNKVSNNYESLKNQYDDYVETNNFDDLDEIPENIINEIEKLDESEKVPESLVKEENVKLVTSLENLSSDLNTENNAPNGALHQPEVSSHNQEVPSNQSDTVSQEPEVGSDEQEVDSYEPEVGSVEPQAGSHEPEESSHHLDQVGLSLQHESVVIEELNESLENQYNIYNTLTFPTRNNYKENSNNKDVNYYSKESLEIHLPNNSDSGSGLDYDSGSDSNILDKVNKTDNTLQINLNNVSSKYNELSLDKLNKMTLKELQDIARKNKLKVKGRKDEVLQRVKSLYNLNSNLK